MSSQAQDAASSMRDRKYELGHEPVGRLLMRYSTPAIVAMFVNSLYNLVDTIFVGRGAGTNALAGLAIAFPIQMFILAVAQVVGIGSASLISRCLGAGDQRRAERVAGGSFVSVTILSALLTAGGLIYLEPLLRLFGATDAILPYAAEYLSVIMAGSFFFAFAVSSNSVVRAEGNAKVAMVSMLIGAIGNIVMDPIFIFTLGMGIRGAAIATVLANVLAFVYLVVYFLSGKSMLKIRFSDLRPDISSLGEVFSVGFSNFTRVAAGSLVAIVMNHALARYGSDTHIALLGVFNRVIMFLFMPLFGLVQGMQPIVGFNYGAKKHDRVMHTFWLASGVATVVSCVGFAVLIAIPGSILALFSKDAHLIAEGVKVLRLASLGLPLVGFQIVGATLFQALGRARPALFLSMSRQILFFLPLLLILPVWLGLYGIWGSAPIADTLSAVVTGLWVWIEVRRLRQSMPGGMAEA